MKSILVTGASGMLGTALCEHFLKLGCRIVAVHRSRPIAVRDSSVTPVQIDLCDKEVLTKVYQEFRPEITLHCAAKISLEGCESDFKDALLQNVFVSRTLAELHQSFSPDAKVPGSFVYISSDAVYPDALPSICKSEAMTPRPASAYGLTKWWAEQAIFGTLEQALVLRTTIVGPARGQFAHWLAESALQGKQVCLFSDVQFSPVSVTHAARMIELCLERNVFGTFNMGSRDFLSKAEFGAKLMSHFTANSSWKLGLLKEAGGKKIRSFNMCLDSNSLAQRLDVTMPESEEVIRECYRLLHALLN